MRYETRITAYDMLDMICISCEMWESRSDSPGRSVAFSTIGLHLQGEGTSDPQQWLRDVLVGLLETL